MWGIFLITKDIVKIPRLSSLDSSRVPDQKKKRNK